MKYVQINSVPNGSTGAIMLQIHNERLLSDDESWVLWGRGRDGKNERECNFGSKLEFYFDVLLTRLFGKAGFHSKRATRRLLARLDEINPDIVHLHNIHGYYLNVEMLFDWLRARKQKTIWTLHDCWAFTGHCSYFTQAGCSQWKTGCGEHFPCPQPDEYPKTYCKSSCVDGYRRKKAAFTSLSSEDLTITVPSQWLADLVSSSFLSRYSIEVRQNEVDENTFKPTESDFRARYGIEDKFVVIGVASPWSNRKGFSDFVRLANDLDDAYAIVLVGLSREQIKDLPKMVIGLERTDSASELAALYTAADVHVQPSIEETFGMTVAEAQACGTPVIVRKGTACVEAASRGECYAVGWEYEDLKDAVIDLKMSRFSL